MLSEELGRSVFFGNFDYCKSFKSGVGSALLDHNFVARDALVELVMGQQVGSKILHPVVLLVDDFATDSDLDCLGLTLGNNQSFCEA